VLVNLKLLRKVEAVVLPSVVEQSTIELDADSAADRKRWGLRIKPFILHLFRQIALRELQTRLMQQQRNKSTTPTPNRPTSLEPVIERSESAQPSPTTVVDLT
jgi:hypothetical protein